MTLFDLICEECLSKFVCFIFKFFEDQRISEMRFSNIIITILLFNSVYLFESIYAWTFAEHYCVVVVPLAICGISTF